MRSFRLLIMLAALATVATADAVDFDFRGGPATQLSFDFTESGITFHVTGAKQTGAAQSVFVEKTAAAAAG